MVVHVVLILQQQVVAVIHPLLSLVLGTRIGQHIFVGASTPFSAAVERAIKVLLLIRPQMCISLTALLLHLP